MSLPKCYRAEMLNRSPGDRIAPVFSLQKVLKGISAGRIFVPRPVVGLEHEYNIAAVLGARGYRKPDDICIDYLLAAAAKLGALSAHGRYAGGYRETVFDRGRRIMRGPGGLPVHLYDDSSKLEVSFGEFTSARAVIAFDRALVSALREIIEEAGRLLREEYDRDPRLLVHLSGGDGSTTCAPLHLNIPWSGEVAHAAYVSREAFAELLELLLCQLTIATTVGATGMPGESGMATDSRCSTFSRLTGCSTLEPDRPMQFERLVARSHEGFESNGAGRNMQMVANWGHSEVQRFLILVLNQIETMRFHLVVAGFYESPPLLASSDNLLDLARRFASGIACGAQMHRRALDERHRFVHWLSRELGQEVVDQLVPGVGEALAWDDHVLTAIERNDTSTLIRTTDFGKKTFLAEKVLRAQGGSWEENLAAIRNVCFAFASPQALSPYFTYFVPNELETRVVGDQDVRDAGPDPLTRGWFLAAVANRWWDDPEAGLDRVAWDWDGISRRWTTTRAGGWIPDLGYHAQTIELPGSLDHNRAASGEILDTIRSLDELFDVFGSKGNKASVSDASEEYEYGT